MTRELVKYRVPLADIVPMFSAGYILAAIDMHNGNRTKAAAWLGIHRNTLQRHLAGVVPPGKPGMKPRPMAERMNGGKA